MPQEKARCKENEEEMILSRIEKSLESRMFGNLHVRFGVGGGVQLPALHHFRLFWRTFIFTMFWTNGLNNKSNLLCEGSAD